MAAKAAMERVVGVMGNRDLEPFIPALVSCIVRPAEVPDIVGKLSATTFVQTIEAPALAVMVPLLVRPHRKAPPRCKACRRMGGRFLQAGMQLVLIMRA